jgi:hypothetical protein
LCAVRHGMTAALAAAGWPQQKISLNNHDVGRACANAIAPPQCPTTKRVVQHGHFVRGFDGRIFGV